MASPDPRIGRSGGVRIAVSHQDTQAFAEIAAAVRAPSGVPYPPGTPVRGARARSPRRARWWLGVGLSAAAGCGLFLILSDGGQSVRATRPALAEIDRMLVAAGLAIGEIRITGHQRTSDETVYAALGPYTAGSLLAFDMDAARLALERLPWIERAVIERILPDRLAITISEREPVALWEHAGRHLLIDRSGRVLAEVDAIAARSLGLLRIAGVEATAEAGHLLAGLARLPALRAVVEQAEWVGERRWTLQLAGGLKALLPADGMPAALARIDGQVQAGVLDRQIAAIDLRPDASRQGRTGLLLDISPVGATSLSPEQRPKGRRS